MTPLRILLADDSASLGSYLKELLEQNGHSVTFVTSGEAAVESYQSAHPEMVLIDLDMPGIGGIEAIKQMKQIQTEAWIPIIVITASSDEGDILKSFMVGADDYLHKPINPLLLEIRLQSMIRISEIQRKSLAVMDAAIDGIVKIDPVGRVIGFNKAAEHIFGYQRQEVIGRNVNMLMPSPYHEEHDEYLGNYMATGHAKIMGKGREVTGLRKNGETFPMSLGVTEAFTSEHRFFVGMVRDLTKEKALQAQLAEKQQLIAGLVDNSDAVTFVKDLQGKYLLINRRFEEVIGISSAAAIGKTDAELFPENLATAFRAADLDVQKTGLAIKTEAFFEKLGSEYHFLSTKFPLFHSNGDVLAVCGIATDITELKKTQQMLERLSEQDELSGLSNRRHFNALGRQEIVRSVRYQEPLSALMLDIDNFKSINDTWGHLAGDQVIKKVSSLIRGVLRDADIAGRVGGEEFAVILPNTTLNFAANVAEKLRFIVSKALIPTPCGKTVSCTISIGVSALNERDLALEDFLAEADGALYQAKKTGRNRVVQYKTLGC
jgi:diguanylate cyclase (GGDEF)-like protein/PAS domain S-box-containing protein